MNIETNFNALVERMKGEIHELINESIATIQGDMLPHVESDTEMNVEYRTNEVVNMLIAGKFTVEKGGDWVTVVVNSHIKIRFDPEPWNKAVDVLAERFSDTAKDMKIARLERELKESYRRI